MNDLCLGPCPLSSDQIDGIKHGGQFWTMFGFGGNWSIENIMDYCDWLIDSGFLTNTGSVKILVV